jgi:hypothetical protein
MKQWLRIEPVALALALAFAVGLILAICEALLPTHVVAVITWPVGLSLAIDEVLVVLLLMILLIVVAQWTVEKAHESLRHFHPRTHLP